jgi:hypothetical protein
MSQKPISPLRGRMLEDMSLRGFTPDTQRDYIRAVKKLASFPGRSPDTATAEDLRVFQLCLTATGVQPPDPRSRAAMPRFPGSLVVVILFRPSRPLSQLHRRAPRDQRRKEIQRTLTSIVSTNFS